MIAELEVIENDIQITDEAITINRAREIELEQMIQESETSRFDLPTIKLYLDEVIYPVLSGLQVMKAWGSRTFIEKNFMTIESYSTSDLKP